MSAVMEYRLGQAVCTPNGPGLFEGLFQAPESIDPTGEHRMLVRHNLDKLTGREAGICMTPGAKTVSGLWIYKPDDVSRF
mgnify:CR=1 FL=1